MKNKNIIYWFEKLITFLEHSVDIKSGKDKLIYSYKVNSIKKSLQVIKNIDFEIKSGDEIKEYKSIGIGTINRIDEIIKTGKLAEVKEDIETYENELMNVFGIGRVKAFELYTKHNIKTIQDLKKAYKNKEIELSDVIIKGLKFYDKIKENIPREEIDEINIYLLNCCLKIDKNLSLMICGSYRREKDISNDIDIIISHPEIKTKKDIKNSDLLTRFINYLEKDKFIVCSLTSNETTTKYMGLCKYKKYPIRRIDVRFIAQASYYTAILYFTGSKDFNKNIRGVALSMGYTLNEYELTNNKKINSEKDIFDYLNMEYIEPSKRN